MSSFVKSVTGILQNSQGEVLLCHRAPKLNYFGGFWVYPGGKIEEELSDHWEGTELEVKDTLVKELFEEIGYMSGSRVTIIPNDRNQKFYDNNVDFAKRREFIEKLVFVGRKQTPPFVINRFDTAYYIISDPIVDEIEATPDNSEITTLKWITPQKAIMEWENGQLKLPPPVLHTLRTLATAPDQFESITLIESSLTIGLQTKVEFAPGIEAVPFISSTIDPFIATNLVIINSKESSLIVDPGANVDSIDEFQEFLVSLPDLQYVVVTHDHKDHWEALEVIENIFPDTQLIVHPKTKERIQTELQTVDYIDQDLNFNDRILRIIYAPGHTDGHIVLFDESTKTLIAGDHVVGIGSSVLSPTTGDMSAYLETSTNLLALQPELIIPAHGPVIFDPIAKLNEYIQHREARERAILNAFEGGAKSITKILPLVYKDVPEAMWPVARSNIMLHLRKLQQDGKIETFDVN